MSVEKFKFRGRFQVWSYSTSHGQLLLRSPKSKDRPSQIDVLFKNVAAIHLPAVFDDIDIKIIQSAELMSQPQVGALQMSGREIFQVIGQNVDGYVVAGIVVANEGDLEYDAISPLLEV
jgi:hypothetical protein